MKYNKGLRFFHLLAAIMMIIVLVGCSSNNGKTKLRVINFRPEDQEFYMWLEKEFEKANPNIDVVYEAVDTGGYAQLLAARLEGELVDVFGTQPANVNSAKTLETSLPLNDLNIWDKIVPSAKQEVMVNGNYLMAPLNNVGNIVYYNKAIFESLNLEEPTTWSEFVTLLDTLKANSGTSTLKAPIIYGGLDAWPIAMIVEAVEANSVRQERPNYLYEVAVENKKLSDMPEYLSFVQKWKKVTEYFQPNATGLGYSRAPGEFGKGGYALMIDGSWSLSQVLAMEPSFEIGFFPLPSNEDASKNVHIPSKGGAAFSIYKGSQNVEEAKKFIEFMYNEEVYERYINFVKGGPILVGLTIEDPYLQEIFSNTQVLTVSNRWIEKMPFDLLMKNEITSGFINGTMTEEQAIALIDQQIEATKDIWQANVQKWLDKFYPENK